MLSMNSSSTLQNSEVASWYAHADGIITATFVGSNPTLTTN